MVEDISWSLDSSYSGTSLADAETWGIQSGSMWRPPVSVRGSVFQTPGRHGSTVTGLPVFEEPQVLLVFQVKADTQAELEALSAELVMRLSDPHLVLQRTSGGVTTSAAARLISVTQGQFVAGRLAEATAILGIPGVFFRGAQSDMTSTLDGLVGSTAPVNDAILRFKNPASPRVTDAKTGTWISWQATALGWYLFVDMSTLTAWLSPSASDWNQPDPNLINRDENVVPNPSFETGVAGVTGFSVSGIAQTTSSSAIRSGSAALTATTLSSPSPSTYIAQTLDATVSPGDWVALSIPARGSGASFRFRVRISWTGAGALSSYSAYTGVTSSAYEVATLSAQAPAGTTGAEVRLYIHGSASDTPPGSSAFTSDEWHAVVEPTQALAEAYVAQYFDGDTEDEAWAAHEWTGTAHASASRRSGKKVAASAALAYPAAGPLQIWPYASTALSGTGDAYISATGGFDELVIRAKPAHF